MRASCMLPMALLVPPVVCARQIHVRRTSAFGQGASASSCCSWSRKWSSSIDSVFLGLLLQSRREKIRASYAVLKANAKDELALVEEPTFKKGMLMEILKDGKPVCVVTDRPEGKKLWLALDQYGNSHLVRPGKVRFIVPGAENFKPVDILEFVNSAKALEDYSLLEIAWQEVVETERTLSTKKLANILFGDASYVECYAVYCMLSSKQEFFRRKQKGHVVFYEPRNASEVEDLRRQYAVEASAAKEFDMYVSTIRSAMDLPHGSKPLPESWLADKFSLSRTEALQALALEFSVNESQRAFATEVLEALSLSKTPQAAVDVLIGMGIFCFHENVELLRSKIPLKFTLQQLDAAELLEKEPLPDIDQNHRVDLTGMKVYTIDSDTAQEIDDALSATQLPDGRLNVWIHIADPTRWVDSDHPIHAEAQNRGTTVYLPEKTIPMFPHNLAIGPMSLKQSLECCAMTVSVVLNEDGSVADRSVFCSTIKPSLRLTYEAANELIMMRLDEERELSLLDRAAQLRYQWRRSQGAIDLVTPQADVKVINAESLEPEIKISITDMTTPSGQLVSEMMILCGEVIAAFGDENMLPLPYRGQTSMAVEMNFNRALEHASLGLPGYVQFTSPIRRYSDLLVHHQVKAVLRNEPPPFNSSQLEPIVTVCNVKMKEARRLSTLSTRYWLLEYLRRRRKDELYEASVTKVRDGHVIVFLNEVGLYGTVNTNLGLAVGDSIKVVVTESHPRKDVLQLELAEVVYGAAAQAAASSI